MINTFILLIMAHALTDFALQGDAMAKSKNRHHISVMIKTIVILVYISVTSLSYSAPFVTNVTGTLNHGSSVTINGSGFGTKNPASPLLWVNAETGSASSYFSDLLPSSSGADYNTIFRTIIRGEAQVHSRSTQYLSGAHYPGTGSGSGWDVGAYKNFGTPLSKSFVSYYYKVDTHFADNFKYDGTDNYKLLNYQNNSNSMYGGCGTGCSYWYWSNYGANTAGWKTPYWIAYGKTDGSGASYPSYYGGTWPHVPGVWSKYEAEAAHGTSGNGASFKVFVDGSEEHNQSGYNEPFQVYGIGVGGYLRPSGYADEWRYFDDIYIDNTWARVVLGNASTWSASTIREIQIPSVWSTTSISITINMGSFNDLNGKYLYVVDSNGLVNTNGYLLGGGVLIIRPNAPVLFIQ